jgi:tRNA G46 methylase TrmB
MDFAKLFSSYPKVTVELGMGDGRLLESLAKSGSGLYVGIEISSEQCAQARSRISLDNVMILDGSFEDVVPAFPDASVDRFVAVLPDPSYIDEKKQDLWKPFYKTVHAKLKQNGTFQLVTEMTDELLQPVNDSDYQRWSRWLVTSFSSIGFIVDRHEGAPARYSSRCLDQFRGDPERIRIATLDMTKH